MSITNAILYFVAIIIALATITVVCFSVYVGFTLWIVHIISEDESS